MMGRLGKGLQAWALYVPGVPVVYVQMCAANRTARPLIAIGPDVIPRAIVLLPHSQGMPARIDRDLRESGRAYTTVRINLDVLQALTASQLP